MFFLFLVVTFFLVVFLMDKMQFWTMMVSARPGRPPMVYGPLAKLAWKFSGFNEDRFMTFQLVWASVHVALIGFVFSKVKIGPAAHRSGIIPAIVVALALAAFWGSLYVRRRRVA